MTNADLGAALAAGIRAGCSAEPDDICVYPDCVQDGCAVLGARAIVAFLRAARVALADEAAIREVLMASPDQTTLEAAKWLREEWAHFKEQLEARQDGAPAGAPSVEQMQEVVEAHIQIVCSDGNSDSRSIAAKIAREIAALYPAPAVPEEIAELRARDRVRASEGDQPWLTSRRR